MTMTKIINSHLYDPDMYRLEQQGYRSLNPLVQPVADCTPSSAK